MAIQYRSSNKQFLKEMHDYIYEYNDNPDMVWNFLKRFIYLDDLFTYALSLFSNQQPERGIGNLNSKIVIVLNSMANKDHMELFKKVFKGINMDHNAVYFTSYQKVPNGDPEKLNYLLQAEIKNISPSIIIQVGECGLQSTEELPVITIEPQVMNLIVHLTKKEESEGASFNQDLKKELQANKKKLWDWIKPMIKYYE